MPTGNMATVMFNKANLQMGREIEKERAINPTLTHFLVFGPGNWGKGETEKEAKANYRKAGGYLRDHTVYRCHPETDVNGMGDFTYPAGNHTNSFRPVVIKRVRKGKQIKAEA